MDTLALIKQVYDLISNTSVKGEDTIRMANAILLLRQMIENWSEPSTEKEEKNG